MLLKIRHDHHHHHRVRLDTEIESRLRSLEEKLDLVLENQETIMSVLDQVQAAYATLHQTIADDIAQENITIQKLADAIAAGNAGDASALLQQMTDDNNALQAQITAQKAAVAPPA